jgi:hypothetical protein
MRSPLENPFLAFLMRSIQINVKVGRLTFCLDRVLRGMPSHNRRAQQLPSPSV